MIGTSEYFANALSTGSVRSSSQFFSAAKVRTPIADAVATKHAHKLRDVLSLVPIHHHAFAMFQRPTSAARLEHDRISAQFVNPNLHRRARAQAGIEKDQRD